MKTWKLLRWFLFLVALHSFLTGINLIAFSSSLMEQFGFSAISEPFFKVQGGVFHLVMAVAYLFAGWHPQRNSAMVWLTITAKCIATIFLFSYYAFVDHILVVLLSGIGDGIMGLIVFVLWKRLQKE
ncbi:MAG: hypothetical protein GF313_05310 [Caldithrix sp.]|nr:hypothetical protein [Caldithrix sp.]